MWYDKPPAKDMFFSVYIKIALGSRKRLSRASEVIIHRYRI